MYITWGLIQDPFYKEPKKEGLTLVKCIQYG